MIAALVIWLLMQGLAGAAERPQEFAYGMPI